MKIIALKKQITALHDKNGLLQNPILKACLHYVTTTMSYYGIDLIFIIVTFTKIKIKIILLRTQRHIILADFIYFN